MKNDLEENCMFRTIYHVMLLLYPYCFFHQLWLSRDPPLLH